MDQQLADIYLMNANLVLFSASPILTSEGSWTKPRDPCICQKLPGKYFRSLIQLQWNLRLRLLPIGYF